MNFYWLVLTDMTIWEDITNLVGSTTSVVSKIREERKEIS